MNLAALQDHHRHSGQSPNSWLCVGPASVRDADLILHFGGWHDGGCRGGAVEKLRHSSPMFTPVCLHRRLPLTPWDLRSLRQSPLTPTVSAHSDGLARSDDDDDLRSLRRHPLTPTTSAHSDDIRSLRARDAYSMHPSNVSGVRLACTTAS